MLGLAEDAAKVMYNASGVEEPVGPGEEAPFDEECGYWLAGGLAHLARASGSQEFARAAWAVHASWLGLAHGRWRQRVGSGRRPWWRFWERRRAAAEPRSAPDWAGGE